MGIAVIERIVDTVFDLNALARVEVEHVVEPVFNAETVVVACNGDYCFLNVELAESGVVVVPLLVGAVVCEVTAVD